MLGSPVEGEEAKRAEGGQRSGALALLCGCLLIVLGLTSQTIMTTFIQPVVSP